MLPAGQRMRHKRDFDTAVRRGRRAGRRTLVVHAATAAATSGHAEVVAEVPARVGLIVSKAVGGAVVRTRVKRQLRAAARARLEALPAGSLVVVRANPAAATAPAAVLRADLDVALARVFGLGPTTGPGDDR